MYSAWFLILILYFSFTKDHTKFLLSLYQAIRSLTRRHLQTVRDQAEHNSGRPFGSSMLSKGGADGASWTSFRFPAIILDMSQNAPNGPNSIVVSAPAFYI